MNTNESDALARDKSDFVRIASEVNDEFCKEDEENVGEEMVIIFGEYNHQKPVDDKTYFGEMKEKLAKGTSYFHYDGTFWNERENVTGFYQTVKLKSGFTRLFFEGDTKLVSWNKNC